MVMGGIVPVVNFEGMLKTGEALDGPTLSAIFLGTVKSWDDPAIKKLNPNVKPPSQAMTWSTAPMAPAPPSIPSPTIWHLAQVSSD